MDENIAKAISNIDSPDLETKIDAFATIVNNFPSFDSHSICVDQKEQKYISNPLNDVYSSLPELISRAVDIHNPNMKILDMMTKKINDPFMKEDILYYITYKLHDLKEELKKTNKNLNDAQEDFEKAIVEHLTSIQNGGLLDNYHTLLPFMHDRFLESIHSLDFESFKKAIDLYLGNEKEERVFRFYSIRKRNAEWQIKWDVEKAGEEETIKKLDHIRHKIKELIEKGFINRYIFDLIIDYNFGEDILDNAFDRFSKLDLNEKIAYLFGIQYGKKNKKTRDILSRGIQQVFESEDEIKRGIEADQGYDGKFMWLLFVVADSASLGNKFAIRWLYDNRKYDNEYIHGIKHALSNVKNYRYKKMIFNILAEDKDPLQRAHNNILIALNARRSRKQRHYNCHDSFGDIPRITRSLEELYDFLEQDYSSLDAEDKTKILVSLFDITGNILKHDDIKKYTQKFYLMDELEQHIDEIPDEIVNIHNLEARIIKKAQALIHGLQKEQEVKVLDAITDKFSAYVTKEHYTQMISNILDDMDEEKIGRIGIGPLFNMMSKLARYGNEDDKIKANDHFSKMMDNVQNILDHDLVPAWRLSSYLETIIKEGNIENASRAIDILLERYDEISSCSHPHIYFSNIRYDLFDHIFEKSKQMNDIEDKIGIISKLLAETTNRGNTDRKQIDKICSYIIQEILPIAKGMRPNNEIRALYRMLRGNYKDSEMLTDIEKSEIATFKSHLTKIFNNDYLTLLPQNGQNL